MILNYKIYQLLESVYNTQQDSKEYTIQKFQISPQMKTADQLRSENNDLFKYVYKQQLEKITKRVENKEYPISYNIIMSDVALDNIQNIDITPEEVLDYTEMAIPYISKSMIADIDFNPAKENIFYFDGEPFAFGFVLKIKNQIVQSTPRYEPTPEIDIIITRVTTPEDENGVVYIHNTSTYKKLNF